METLKAQFAEFSICWREVFQMAQATPAVWQPHLPGGSVEQIDEVVTATSTFVNQIEEPGGFKPSFHLAKSVAATTLPQLLVAVKNLQKADYKFLPGLVIGLNQILSATHTMLVFSGDAQRDSMTAGLAAQLSESIALIQTAQKELSQKHALLTVATDCAERVEEKLEGLKTLDEKARSLLNQKEHELSTLLADTQKQSEQLMSTTRADLSKERTEGAEAVVILLSDAKAKVTELLSNLKAESDTFAEGLSQRSYATTQEITKLSEIAVKREANISLIETDGKRVAEQLATSLEDNKKFGDALTLQSKLLETLQQKAEQQQSLISALLPKGASAGLASGFEARAQQLETTKIVWMVAFIVSILALISVTCLVTFGNKVASIDVWKELLHRLPLVAPFIWLGWFSAVQYGNTIRVQEDYAFKAATSKAFAGYRDHMQHMATVDLAEANTAMTLLAARTIEILAHEPLRIYNKAERDVSPSGSLIDAMWLKGKKVDK